MNLLSRPYAPAAVIILAAFFAAGCSKSVPPSPAVPMPAATASDTSSQSTMVGTVPAGPTKEDLETTSAAKSDMSKGQEANAMPMPRQANDDSTPLPNAAPKATPQSR